MARLAIVTGASGGLGLEFAKLLAADGYDLALVARSSDRLEALATSLRATYGVAVEPIAQDLGVLDAARALFARVPRCDVLVNNAGFANNGRFDTIAADAIREELLLDVVTLTELTHAYLPGMLGRGEGNVLNVASTAGFLPGPFMAVYYAAKGYVISFSEALWEEYRGTGVSITCLAPGATATGFVERANVQNTLLFNRRLADAAETAKAGYRGMQRGQRLVVPGLANKLLSYASRFSPRRPLLWVSRKAVEPRR